jgi:hypothetical protein
VGRGRARRHHRSGHDRLHARPQPQARRSRPCRSRKSHPLPHQQRQARRLHHHQGPRHLQHRHRPHRAAVESEARKRGSHAQGPPLPRHPPARPRRKRQAGQPHRRRHRLRRGKATHADLSNTTFALEALYYAQSLLADKGDAAKNEPQLNFGAAIDFIQRCQNRPESNKSSWVSKDPKDAGGFIYNPTETRGAKVENPDGTISLRSYGSISYAGLLSFIYAGLDKNDPRVKAVIEWISANYSADENPGLGAQGLYYYYHTLSKALSIAQIDFIKTKDGKLIDWRADITQKLLNLQKGDGSWANSEGRWMESDPVLTTSYILMALGRIHQTL